MNYLDHLRTVPTVAQLEGFATEDEAYQDYLAELEANTIYCSICDGIGHGQPGYGPCPVFEDTGYRDADDEREEYLLRNAGY